MKKFTSRKKIEKIIYSDSVIPMKDFLNIESFNHFAFPLTNACDLKCDCCSVHANLPISKESVYPERRTLYRMKVEEIETIVSTLGDVGKHDWHRLTGGEPTLYIDDCIDAIDYLYSVGRKNICLATNGFRLMEIPKRTLNKIQWIELDNHGVNDELIQQDKKYLDVNYENYLRVIKYNKHYDLHYARFHERNQYYCGHIIRVIKFRDGVIYPCGHYECLTTFRHDTEIQDLLTRYNWTYDNPDVSFLLKNWRETIPMDVFKYCLSCWRPNEDIKTFTSMGGKKQ
jgi:organic radical activating enzyme